VNLRVTPQSVPKVLAIFSGIMLRATQSSEIPAADLARVKPDDSDRTRMLKSVMRSVAKFASSGLGKRKDESAQAAGQLIMKSREEDDDPKGIVLKKGRNPCDWGLLSPRQRTRLLSIANADEFYMDLVGDDEFRDLLKDSAGKVRAHCDSLSIDRPLPEERVVETSPVDGICLVPGLEAEDTESGGTANYKMIDRAAWSWVHDNVHFKELDKLNNTIDENEYEGLRRGFPAQTKYHAVLHALTDHSLDDKKLWKAAIQEAMFPTMAPDVPKGTTKGFAARTMSKTKGGRFGRRNSLTWSDSIGLPGASGRGKLPTGGRMQKDRSAPTLLLP